MHLKGIVIFINTRRVADPSPCRSTRIKRINHHLLRAFNLGTTERTSLSIGVLRHRHNTQILRNTYSSSFINITTNSIRRGQCQRLKVKGPKIYIVPLTGKREQQRFTVRSGIVTGISIKQRSTISDRP